mgnify:CR=1 FL=1
MILNNNFMKKIFFLVISLFQFIILNAQIRDIGREPLYADSLPEPTPKWVYVLFFIIIIRYFYRAMKNDK